MAVSLKKKFFWSIGLLLLAVLGAVGAAVYFVTRPLETEFAQDPNVVEAHEANRKLKLLNEAQSERRQGFVRLSETEINSFLDGRYTGVKMSNGPIRLVKAGVRLGASTITFITWHQAPLLGLTLPLVWQRVVAPVKETNGWSFELRSMRVGRVDVPEEHWFRVEKFLGPSDAVFEERKSWLQKLPLIAVADNEQSKTPELRLYTYLPEEKTKQNETASE